jgi:miniconductance mechanosensitive channel
MDFLEHYLDLIHRNYPYIFWACGLFLSTLIIFGVFRKILFPYQTKLFESYSNKWALSIERSKILHILPHIMTGVVALFFSKQWLPKCCMKPTLIHLIHAYLGVTLTVFLYRFIKVVENLITSDDDAYNISLKGCSQFISLIVIIVGITVSLCLLLDVSPTIFLGSFGAATAILTMVFKDTLISLVTSIQIALNKLIKKGDLIHIESKNILGTVLDVGLNFVRIKNPDETITTLPTHKIFETPVRNWSNLAVVKMRQIKKAFLIDQTTIMPLKPAALDVYKKNPLLKDLIDSQKTYETNIALFRACTEAMLRGHEKIHQKKIILLRFLDPTAQGLPVEIRAFTTEFLWEPHERVQADVLEKTLLILSACDLKIYQGEE